MKSLLDAQEVELPCEACGHKTKQRIGWIKAHTQFTCRCGTVIRLDTRQFKTEIAKVERSLAALKRSLE